jgi:hypothetical protein
MPLLLTWEISQIIVDYLSPIVTTCVLNESSGHWPLTNALNFVISLSLKLKENSAPLASFDNLIEDKPCLAEKLAFLVCNIRTQV